MVKPTTKLPEPVTAGPFRYGERLDGLHIRLLRIVIPRRIPTMLEVVLETHALEDASYDALSYTWGDIPETELIICNGHHLSIGKNLYDALCVREGALRQGVEPHPANEKDADGEPMRSGSMCQEYLWADAICINQTDESEKTAQVRIMGDIYTKAVKVFAWLGQGDDKDYEGISFASWLHAELVGRLGNIVVGSVRRGSLESLFPDHLMILDLPYWQQIFEILSHPWFSRVWVIQELCLAKTVVFWRGRNIFEIEIFMYIALLLDACLDLRNRTQVYQCGPAREMAQLWKRYRESGPVALIHWVCRTTSMKATDPRDKFFALVSISNSLPLKFIDYSLDYRDVAASVAAQAWIGNPNGPDILAFIDNPEIHNQDLPSWMPDWLSTGRQSQLSLAVAYPTEDLRRLRDVPQVEMTGFSPVQFELDNVEAEHRTFVVDALNVNVKVSAIDAVRSIVPRPVYKISSQYVQDHQRHSKFLSNFDENAFRERLELDWLIALRRLANPDLPKDADFNDGSDFDPFLRTLYYNWEQPPVIDHIPMHTSFCAWYMLKKLFLQYHASKNLDYFHAKVLPSVFPLVWRFLLAYAVWDHPRKFVVTHAGRFGWVPLRAKEDDTIFIFKGGRIPFIARPVDGGGWEYIGPCYVHGLMDGEAWDLPQNEWRFMHLV